MKQYIVTHKYDRDPSAFDDSAEGFDLYQQWINTTTGERFECKANTVGAAEWESLTIDKSYVQPISFAITDKFTFKPAYALSITSADISSNITDLRVGKNGATPTTITYPYAVLATDILTFEVSFTDAYNRELSSFITLIGTLV